MLLFIGCMILAIGFTCYMPWWITLGMCFIIWGINRSDTAPVNFTENTDEISMEQVYKELNANMEEFLRKNDPCHKQHN